jgi:hypothetical protein
VRVTETVAELDKGALLPEKPKSRAGRRVVAIPPDLVPELRWHRREHESGTQVTRSDLKA